MNEIFSTREMSRLCGVNESTIKRWADSGRLRCLKTPGGHRKFRLRDVLAFLNAHGYERLGITATTALPGSENAMAVRILRGDWPGLAGGFLEAGLRGTVPDVVTYLLQLVSGGCGLTEICDRVISPALVKLGEQWQEGQASILEEHVMSAATIHGLERLRETLPKQDANGLVAFCSPVEGENHEIGIRMSALLLDRLGWDVRLAINGTPVAPLVDFVRSARPRLVCLSAVAVPVDDSFVARTRLVWQATRESGTRLALGGQMASGRSDVPCDLSAGSLAALESFAGELASRRSGRNASL